MDHVVTNSLTGIAAALAIFALWAIGRIDNAAPYIVLAKRTGQVVIVFLVFVVAYFAYTIDH